MDYLKVLEDGPLAAWLLLPKIVSPCVSPVTYIQESFTVEHWPPCWKFT